ncbi:hypothetical protein GIB67_034642 [Kingdonia uniflora]|uniref:Uncharacterized protein n=1 Tax=Kingdonia uniflora TaxID=39325 RepID=A0A7J7N3P9_9MAGN|nr:hypothetical protein GIB67_034642 [Kingdonia uniflora]
MVGHNLSECRGIQAQVQREEDVKDKRNHGEARKGTGEHNEGNSFTKNQKKKIKKKRNKEKMNKEKIASTDAGVEAKADAGIGSSEAGTKEGIASSSRTEGKDHTEFVSDMVEDKERDEACIAQAGGSNTKKAKREPKIRPDSSILLRLHNFNHSIISNDCEIRIGNLWCFWHTEVFSPSVISSSFHHLTVLCNGAIISAVHASVFKTVRRRLWKDLINVSKLNLPWLVLGDFNIIRLQTEKFGGSGPTLSAINEFNDCLDECELLESVTLGIKLTWCNGQSGGARISRRMDRALYNSKWASSFDGW